MKLFLISWIVEDTNYVRTTSHVQHCHDRMLYRFVKKAMEDDGMFLGLDRGPPGQGRLQNCAAMSACRSHPLEFKVRKLGLMHKIREITLSVCL